MLSWAVLSFIPLVVQFRFKKFLFGGFMPYTTEVVFTPMQKAQFQHDKLAHRDILNFGLYYKIKHMVLHFFKYAGRVQCASATNDFAKLTETLIDTLIICLATANALNLILGKRIHVNSICNSLEDIGKELCIKDISEENQIFKTVINDFLVIGGAMAKAAESTDHFEVGDFRSDINHLTVEMTKSTIIHLYILNVPVLNKLEVKYKSIESKLIQF